jgi:KTSC domain
MKHITVESSMIDLIGYDAISRTLEVRFINSGDTYQYFRVPPAVWKRFKAADSKGRFMGDEIIDFYAYAKLGRRSRW